ncbi:MAG: CvpA family protein [Lachnospiraceae bacterium]|nr:CvpA family protein [Lachnospiraceae bacterium]
MCRVHMEAVLLVPIIYLVIETILGYKRGLIQSVLLLISWILSFAGSALLVREFAKNGEKIKEFAAYFEEFTGPDLAQLAAYVFLFLLLVVFIKIFCHIIMHFSGIISNIPVVGTINRILGAVFGFLKGGILVFAAFLVYAVYNGMYMDILWQKIPGVMEMIQQIIQYLKQLWMMVL